MPSWLIVSLIVIGVLGYVTRAFVLACSYKFLVEVHVATRLDSRLERLGIPSKNTIPMVRLPDSTFRRVWLKLLLRPIQPTRTFGQVIDLADGNFCVYRLVPGLFHFDMKVEVHDELQLERHQNFMVHFTEKAPQELQGNCLHLDRNGLYMTEEI